jgi:hypothetical protein
MTAAFTQALEAQVNKFMKQVPEPSEEDIEKKRRYQAVIELEGAETELGKQLSERIKKLAPSYAAHKKQRGMEIAEALKVSCDELGIPIQVKASKAKTTKKTNAKPKITRITQAQMAEYCEKVLVVLPPKGDPQFMPKAKVAKQTELDPEVVQKVLTKLKTNGQAQNNGERGPKAGWQGA